MFFDRVNGKSQVIMLMSPTSGNYLIGPVMWLQLQA